MRHGRWSVGESKPTNPKQRSLIFELNEDQIKVSVSWQESVLGTAGTSTIPVTDFRYFKQDMATRESG